ncbi:MAG: hypothetical protein ACC656_13135 [Candidatus Heimdallarchaeota archaeon]
MRIEREITDTLQIALSVFILSLIFLSEKSKFKGNEFLFIGLIIITLGTFIHIILVQLEALSLLSSRYFAYLGIIGTLITVIGYIQYDKSEFAGFWDNIGLSYVTVFNLSLIILVITSIISPQTKRAATL